MRTIHIEHADLHFGPLEPLPGEPFSFECERGTVRGRVTVAEVVPLVFVFTIYAAPDCGPNCGFITHEMVAAFKSDSPSVAELRAKCLSPTERDRRAYRDWLKPCAS